MSPKRGDRVAPPPGPGDWDVRYGTTEAKTGWEDLCRQAPGNTKAAWNEMRTNPLPQTHTPRHHPLRGALAQGTYRGRALPCWQIEVTGSGRIWYLADAEDRTVWVVHAGTGHPRVTG